LMIILGVARISAGDMAVNKTNSQNDHVGKSYL